MSFVAACRAAGRLEESKSCLQLVVIQVPTFVGMWVGGSLHD